MKARNWYRSTTGSFLLALAVALLSSPASLYGQEAEGPEVSEEQLTAYANAYLQIANVRDEAHDALAATANKTDEAQERIREELEEQIASILEENGLTREEYEQITLLVSTDQQHAESFENALQSLENADAAAQGDGAESEGTV